jgi:hypothetical protein
LVINVSARARLPDFADLCLHHGLAYPAAEGRGELGQVGDDAIDTRFELMWMSIDNDLACELIAKRGAEHCLPSPMTGLYIRNKQKTCGGDGQMLLHQKFPSFLAS